MQSVMEIRLPFRLAIPSNHEWLSGYEEGARKWRYKIILKHRDLVISGVDWEDEPLRITTATIWTDINIEEVDGTSEQLLLQPTLRIFFLLMLEYLNRVIDAYRTVEADYSVRPITLSDLPESIDIDVDGHLYRYVVNLPLWVSKNEEDPQATKERMDRIGELFVRRDRWPEFVNIKQFYASARHSVEQGRYANAIIELETTFEMQTRLALRLALDKHGVREPKYSGALQAGLKNVVKDLLPKYLGGNFSLKDPGPIADWYNNLYSVRNACVHEGRIDVTGEEAIAAIDAYHAAQQHITTRMIAQGILSSDGGLDMEKHAPRRNVELHPDMIVERYKEIGFLGQDARLGESVLEREVPKSEF